MTLLALCHAPANRLRLVALGVEPRVRTLVRGALFSSVGLSASLMVGGEGGGGSPGKGKRGKKGKGKGGGEGVPSVAARLCDALQVRLAAVVWVRERPGGRYIVCYSVLGPALYISHDCVCLCLSAS